MYAEINDLENISGSVQTTDLIVIDRNDGQDAKNANMSQVKEYMWRDLVQSGGAPTNLALVYDTVDDMKDSTATVGTKVKTYGYYVLGDGGGADYVIYASTSEGTSFYITLNNGNKAVLADREVHPLQVGFRTNLTDLDTIVKVDANWLILKNLIADLKTNKTRDMVKFDRLLSLNRVYTEWISNRNCPIGFYSDSTTDGATTTGHVKNTYSDATFKVTINDSPNAYPTKLVDYIKMASNKPSIPVSCYNGGFDGMSFVSGFGLRYWYNTWFRGLLGSNVDYSDVRMIVIGFGTNDIKNAGNTAPVVDSFSRDLECAIIDSFLRGVQPVIQSPVINSRRVGSTVNSINGDETITIIESVEKELCLKYNLEYISMRDPLDNILDMYTVLNFGDFMSATDMLHPTDMGHRLHAGYLCTLLNPNIAKIDENKSLKTLWAGHPNFVMNPTEIIAPVVWDGTVLKEIPDPYNAPETYYYDWAASEGNTKVYGDLLMQFPCWCDRPTALYYNKIDNDDTTGRNIDVYSTIVNTTETLTVVQESYVQPETTYYSDKTFVCLLPAGLSHIKVYANHKASNQRVGSFYLAEVNEQFLFELGRGSSTSNYYTKLINFHPVFSTYTSKMTRRKNSLIEYYNGADGTAVNISFKLITPLDTVTSYVVYSHFNDVQAYKDCYNSIVILNNTVTLRTRTLAATNIINTQTIAGLNALLVSGAEVLITYISNFSGGGGVSVRMYVDGTLKYTYTSTVLGQIWTEGYDLAIPSILAKDLCIATKVPVDGFDLIYLI